MKFLSLTFLQRLWSLAASAAIVFTLAAHDVGIVTVSVASMRAKPAHSSELETQAIAGMVVSLAETNGDWIKALTPDGYEAFIHRTAVTRLTESELDEWTSSPRLVVKSLRRVWVMPDSTGLSDEPLMDLVNGAIVGGSLIPGSRYAKVWLPGGMTGFVAAESVVDFHEWSGQHPSAEKILRTARSLMGTPYLWGGTSVLGVDCSGLTRVAFYDSGILLPRNASQQAKAGSAVDPTYESLRPGDLVFFAADSISSRITHVGIYEGNGRVIHASGTVHRSHLFTDTIESLPQRLRCARRIF